MTYTNAFTTPSLDEITYIPGRPRAYRGDCKAGAFKIGESKFVGAELVMEILSYRTFEAELFDYPRQGWGELIFVDPYNIVSHILIKTQSLENFLDFVLDLTTQRKALATGITTAKMVKKTSDLGTYYTVEFRWATNKKERVEQLREFVSDKVIFASRLRDSLPTELTDPVGVTELEEVA